MKWLSLNNFYYKGLSRYLKLNWIALLLLVISLWDIRYEIRLLLENFTFTGLLFAIYNHPLAIIVLILIPRISKIRPN